MRYISIDVATKSLAISIVEHNDIPIDLQNKTSFKNLTIVKTITRDLAPGRSSDTINEVDRISLINEFFVKEIKPYITSNTIALIEKQISTTPSYIVYVALITLFTNLDTEIEIIAAARKNQLSIDGETIGKYLRECVDSYRANKQHSKGLVSIIRPYLTDNHKIEINKKMIIDWSDTISQLIAFLVHQTH